MYEGILGREANVTKGWTSGKETKERRGWVVVLVPTLHNFKIQKYEMVPLTPDLVRAIRQSKLNSQLLLVSITS